MKVSLLSENLQKKLIFANHAISNKSQLPILLNFLIKASKNNLVIKATDLEIGISVEIPAKIDEEGITTVPARTFSELISLVPKGKITLLTKKEGLELTGEKIKTNFQTIAPEDFPKLYEEMGEEKTTITKEVISKEFPKVVFAASQDIGRPALSGVLLKVEKEELLLVATDGYRLSLKKHILESKKKEKRVEDVLMIVPARVIKELMFMQDYEGDTRMFAGRKNNQIIFSGSETTLIGRLIEAEFPNYEKILPVDFSTKTIFDRENLQKAVKVCYIFARETANIIKLSILKDRIIVSANTPQVGENTVEVEAEAVGEDNQIAFNARYLLEILSNVSEDRLSFEMTGPLSPGVFKIVNDNTFLHLIMPIRLQE